MKRKINLINGLFPSLYSIKLQLVISILFCSTFQIVNSQTSHIPDSLKDKTYKELYKGFKLCQNNYLKGKTYAEAYLHKAKNEKDTIKIANAYSQYASISIYPINIKYCDSLINLTKDSNNIEYPGFAFMVKGEIYYNIGEYQKALNSNITAHKYATKNKNSEQLIYIENAIGVIKNFWGNSNEALINFKSTLNLLENQKNHKSKNYNRLYLSSLFSLSNSYLLLKKYDSAQFYINKGIQKSLITNDSVYYYSFVSQSGILAFYQNNFKIAIDSLDKALPYDTGANELLNNHFYRGNIYQKQNKEKKAFYHFKKADSIYNATNDVVSEVRNIQEYFVNYYKNNDDIKNQLVYINRLLKVDSILNKNYKNINEILIKKYDTPLLLSQKEKIINTLKHNSLKNSYTILGLILIIIIFILFFLWNNYRQKSIAKSPAKDIFDPINQIQIEEKTKKEPSKEQITISQEVIDSVLDSLNEFENNHDYLENKLTLNKLSKKLNTNSNYLSKIINTHKQMNFSSYISNLRIEYCLQKMKNDSKFRKYTINAIAFEIGFNNVESFSKAFYKKTYTYPSTYIKEIEKSILA